MQYFVLLFLHFSNRQNQETVDYITTFSILTSNMLVFLLLQQKKHMVKVETSDVKKGTILQMDNGLFRVVDTSHTHMGRQGATYSFKIKEITTGKTKVFTCNSGTTLEQADVQTMNALFLYQAGPAYTFMVTDTAEMVEMEEDTIEDISGYLKENLDVFLMMFEGNVL